MLRRVALLLIPFFLFTLIQTSVANDSVYDNLPVISIDNAPQIQQLSSIGGELQGRLVWSPDNIHLAVGTSVGIQVYDSQNLDTPPIQIDVAGINFNFNEVGEIVVDDQRWDIMTGEILADVEQDNRIFSPGGIEVIINQVDEQTEIMIIKPDNASITIPTAHDFDDIVFSPDEQFALLILQVSDIYHEYEIIQLWNIEDGIIIADLPQNLGSFGTVTFFADGNLLLTTSYTDGGMFDEAVVWDGHTGERLNNRAYPPAIFSPDGELLALTGGGITLWSNRELGMLTYPSEDWSGYGMQFSPDSHTIATQRTRAILLWDVSNEQVSEDPYLIFETETVINGLFYSLDGHYLASIERDGIAEVWDAQTGMRQARLDVEGDFSHRGVKFSPDGRFLRARDNTGNVYFLDIETDTTRIVELPLSAIINSDWTQAVYWDEGIVRIVALETGEASEIEIIADYFGNIIGFSADSGLIMFEGDSIRGYDLYSADKVFEQAISENHRVNLQFNDDGSQFLFSSRSQVWGMGESPSAEIWEVSNWTAPLSVFNDSQPSGSLLFSPDNHYISELWSACGDGGGGDFIVWDAHTGERLQAPRLMECGPYGQVFTPDAEWLIINWNTSILLLKIDEVSSQSPENDGWTPASKGLFYNNLSYPLRQITVSLDSTVLALHLSAGSPYEAPIAEYSQIELFHLSDLLDSNNQTTYGLESIVIPNATQTLFSPDSRYILTDNGFWDAQTGEQVASISSTIASFNPDGSILATYESGQVHLWDVDALINGSEQALITVDIENVQELAFNPDSTVLFIKGAGNVQLWGIP